MHFFSISRILCLGLFCLSGPLAVAETYGVRLTWRDNATNEAAYELQRGAGADPTVWDSILLPANATAYVDIGRAADSVLTYRVRCSNAAGSSGWAGPVTVTMPAGSVPPPLIPPDAPDDFRHDPPVLEIEAPPNVTIRIEAENGTLVGAATKTADALASGGNYVALSATGAAVTLTFNVTTAGSYALRARVRSETAQSDSYQVTIDGGVQDVWNLPRGPGWATHTVALRDVPGPRNFAVGRHTVKMGFREACQLDWLELFFP